MARKSEWNPIWLVKIYKMLRIGLKDLDVCKTLGISKTSFYRYVKEKPELREAIKMAEKELAERQDLPAWVNARLSPELAELWRKIERWDGKQGGISKIEQMLEDHGERVRQQLFLHALCVLHFDPSQALRKVNLTKRELQKWINTDVEFAELVEEIDFHKGNFFESTLVQLVAEKNPAAVIFANRSYNSRRGYGVKDKLEVNHTGAVMVGVIDLAELMPFMSQDTVGQVMEAIRKKELVDNRVPGVVEKLGRDIQKVVEMGD